MRTIHYVGFTGDEFVRARRLFGGPVMIHRRWDRRAQRDIGPDDMVIFATGDDTQPLSRFNGDDYDERAFFDPKVWKRLTR
ncbi:MAG: hypothetical protein KDK08_05475 [Rhizobiaceae bacterium]|nr:hypothetical protein [Rhizobiaceae bacterium]MCC0000919.1 hypothetical protein [Methylobacteriaceae bacterium]